VRAFVLFLGLVSLTACSSPRIQARSFYTSRKDLASYVLDTPDPEKSTMGLGQVIWVRWIIPHVEEGVVIDATLRFKNGSEKNTVYPLSSKWGWLMIEIPSEERAEKGDLLSYKILLRRNDEILSSTKHKLWVEKVEIKDL
jgi:hypothetical protein